MSPTSNWAICEICDQEVSELYLYQALIPSWGDTPLALKLKTEGDHRITLKCYGYNGVSVSLCS